MADETPKTTTTEEKVATPKYNQAMPTIIINNIPQEKLTQEDVEKEEVSNDELYALSEDSYLTDPFFYELADYFNIERKEYGDAAPLIREIAEYAIKVGKCKTKEDVLLSISSLERKVQPTAFGEKRYKNVYRWAKLANQKREIENEMKAYELD